MKGNKIRQMTVFSSSMKGQICAEARPNCSKLYYLQKIVQKNTYPQTVINESNIIDYSP